MKARLWCFTVSGQFNGGHAVKKLIEATGYIILELWGDDSFFNSRSLHVFITKLRHKLSRDEHIRIVNVRGIGYKLIG